MVVLALFDAKAKGAPVQEPGDVLVLVTIT